VDSNNIQVTEPGVTKKKFESELSAFRLVENEYQKKGVLCLKIEFPKIEFAFIAHTLKPPPVVFTVSIDFTNYDLEPPSITFIDLITRQRVRTKEVYAKFFKVIPGNMLGQGGQIIPINIQSVLIGEPEDFPFLCIPGVREYHNHPQHTGNNWLLLRKSGEGKLAFLLDQLYNHSIPYITSYHIGYTVGINQQIS
jgi:hypothetical protein